MSSNPSTTWEPLSEATIRRLPKADIHCHLDGFVRPETVLELAKEQGVALPTYDLEELGRTMRAGPDCADLVAYLRAFSVPLSVLQRGDAISRAFFEACESATRDGIIYLELRFSPVLHTNCGLSIAEVIDAAVAGVRLAESRLPITARVICCAMRQLDADVSVRIADAVCGHGSEYVVALDIARPEVGFPIGPHRGAFERAREHHVHVTVHAGEACGAGSIDDALACGAQRIGHGTRIVDDERLLQDVVDRGVTLEVCLTSNFQTKAAETPEAHPVRRLFDRGVRVALCTDNPTVSNTTLTREYVEAQRLFGFGRREILHLIDNAIDAAFLPDTRKQQLRRDALDRASAILGLPLQSEHRHEPADVPKCDLTCQVRKGEPLEEVLYPMLQSAKDDGVRHIEVALFGQDVRSATNIATTFCEGIDLVVSFTIGVDRPGQLAEAVAQFTELHSAGVAGLFLLNVNKYGSVFESLRRQRIPLSIAVSDPDAAALAVTKGFARRIVGGGALHERPEICRDLAVSRTSVVVTDFEVAKRLLAHGVRVALAGRRLPHAAVTDWPLVLRLAANAFWGMLAPHRSRVALSRIIRTGSPSAIIDELGQSPRTPWEGAWSEGSVVGAYVIASKLQQTRFSVVFEAFHLSKGGKFAFKVMNDPAQAQAEFTTYTAIRDCPFIVRVRSRTDWGFFMEYYAGGDLIDWFNRNRRPFTVDEARVAIFRVLKALEWLHDHGVAHLDIKLDNILLAGGMDTFLADFGLAMTITQQPFKYRLVMSDGYRPPELLDKQPFTHKVDMWGAGVTLYLMLTGLPPFNNDDAARKASWPQANITSRDAREVIGGLLIADPGERWTAARALKHQFFTGLDLSVQTKAALKDVGPDDAAFVGAGYSH